jgi:hypothetical protein
VLVARSGILGRHEFVAHGVACGLTKLLVLLLVGPSAVVSTRPLFRTVARGPSRFSVSAVCGSIQRPLQVDRRDDTAGVCRRRLGH